MRRKAILVLENGEVFYGYSLGRVGTTVGEVVFNTSMSGYQEILTDPSYKGQIVTMTYTQIGNYGYNDDDYESDKPYVEGFVVRESSSMVSNFRAKGSLNEYLERYDIVGIEGVDTRKLTKILRVKGSLVGAISSEEGKEELLRKIKKFSIVGKDLVSFVSTKEPYIFKDGLFKFGYEVRKLKNVSHLKSKKVVVVDFGVKRNILRYLVEVGFEVEVVPYTYGYKDIVRLSPDAVFFSNGPGDPRGIPDCMIEEYKKVINSFPCFGICFGHQIIARAFGIGIYKMKFGHHGGNHPVKDIENGKIFVTAQNHNYAVDDKAAYDKGFEVTYVNMNDGSVEGMTHKDLPIMSVQFHPEASPGPHDAEYIFEKFALMVKN